MKTVYQTTHDGAFAGETIADESPLEPGVYLIPAGCVEDPPPETVEGFFARWHNGEWIVEPLPEPVITGARRIKDGSIIATIDGAEVSVPDDMASALRQKLAKWEAKGNSIADYVEPVPQSVTMAQARIVLQMTGQLVAIQAGLEALEEPQRSVALTAWEYAPTVSRNGSLVQTLSAQFGMSEEDLDALFIAAGNIEL